MKLKPAWEFLKTLYSNAVEKHDILLVAGAVTYNITLAVVPFLVFVLTLLPFFIPKETVAILIDQLQVLIPTSTAQALIPEIERILVMKRNNILVVSLLASLWSASSATNAIRKALNRAYNVTRDQRSFIHNRLLAAIGAITAAGAIFIAGAAIIGGNEVIDFVQSKGFLQSPWLVTAIQAGRFLISILLVSMVWSFMYWLLPYNKPDNKYKLFSLGAVVGVAIWVMASIGFSIFVSHFSNYDTTYGSLAGVIISLLWVYISALALLLGAEINFAHQHWKCLREANEVCSTGQGEANGDHLGGQQGDPSSPSAVTDNKILNLIENVAVLVLEKHKSTALKKILAYFSYFIAALFFFIALTLAMATVFGNWAYLISALIFLSAGYLLNNKGEPKGEENGEGNQAPDLGISLDMEAVLGAEDEADSEPVPVETEQ